MLLINAPPWWPVTNMCAYISEKFALSFHHTARPHIKCILPVNIFTLFTLFAKKNIAIACTLLNSPCSAILMCSNVTHVKIHNKTGLLNCVGLRETILAHRPFKFVVFTKTGIYKLSYWTPINVCTCITHNVSKHFLSLNYAKLSQYTIFHWIMKYTNYI